MPAEASVIEPAPLEELIDEIVEVRKQRMLAKIRKQEKRNYMYLSDIHKCTRHNYYSMVEGDKRRPINEWLQSLFDAGNIFEDEVVRELLAMRFRVVKAQQSIRVMYGGRVEKLRGQIIGSGKIDGMISYKGHEFPLEIKSLDSNVYRAINTIEDLFKHEYTEKYLRQLLMYLYGNNMEAGFFLINDRGGHWKLIPVYLGNHLDYCEKVLRTMEAAFEAKAKGEVPDRITYNHRTCGNCQFNAVCCPETILEGADVLDDPDLEAEIARHEELKPKAKEYDEVHASLKMLFREKPQTTIGHFIVVPKKTSRRGSLAFSNLPDKLKKLCEEHRGEPTESWSFKVDDINKKPEKEPAA